MICQLLPARYHQHSLLVRNADQWENSLRYSWDLQVKCSVGHQLFRQNCSCQGTAWQPHAVAVALAVAVMILWVAAVGCGFLLILEPLLDMVDIIALCACPTREPKYCQPFLQPVVWSKSSCRIWIPNSSRFSMHDAQLVLSMLLNDTCPQVVLSVHCIASSTGAAETIDHLRL